MIYFTADGRVDFRLLVRELADAVPGGLVGGHVLEQPHRALRGVARLHRAADGAADVIPEK